MAYDYNNSEQNQSDTQIWNTSGTRQSNYLRRISEAPQVTNGLISNKRRGYTEAMAKSEAAIEHRLNHRLT